MSYTEVVVRCNLCGKVQLLADLDRVALVHCTVYYCKCKRESPILTKTDEGKLEAVVGCNGARAQIFH
jgi:hypothetical protein